MTRSVLLVDDEIDILDALARFFEVKGWETFRAATAREGLRIHSGERPDLVVLDLKLPDLDGLDALTLMRNQDPAAAVIMLTGHGDIPTAVEAMRLGAENFLAKPVELDHLEAAAHRALEKVDLRRRNLELSSRLRKGEEDELSSLGSSSRMKEVARQVELLSRSEETTVLILGESGSGKGWLARVIHDRSPRASNPFVDINCAGLSAHFLESELFGHEKGAFTDAKERKRGLFEVADGGTVFLDEVGDLAPEIQPKLLKALEERRFRRLGGTREISVNVRLIAASNRDLESAVKKGGFREDLYYRLCVMPVHLPALRDRSDEDVLELVRRIFQSLAQRMGAHESDLSPETLRHLLDYPWPGNVRELRNVLERALILAGGPEARDVGPEHLPVELRKLSGQGSLEGGRGFHPESLEEVEKRHIARTLLHHGGNRTRSARDLGISRVTLLSKIRKFGLENVGRE